MKIENDIVYEFASSCHCDHNSLENKRKSFCNFGLKCRNNIKNDIHSEINKESILDFEFKDDCACDELAFPILKNLLNDIDYKNFTNEALTEELKQVFKTDFVKMNSYSNNEEKNLLQHSVAIFAIKNIIKNHKLKIPLDHEIDLFKLIVDKLKANDEYFFKNEKINYALTYIFYFYRKYFFSKLEMICPMNVNLLSPRRRSVI